MGPHSVTGTVFVRSAPVLVFVVLLGLIALQGAMGSPGTETDRDPTQDTCLFNTSGQPSGVYHSHINWQFEDPSDLSVIVVTPAYVSYEGVLENRSWLSGGDPLQDYPGVQVILEAIDYWEWSLALHADRWPVLAQIQWSTNVLGVDASVEDLAAADIVVITGFVTDPAPWLFTVGLGLPVPCGATYQEQCVVWNSGLGTDEVVWDRDEEPNMRLRNLALHEFGHCLGAGHTFNESGNRLFEEVDVMAGSRPNVRQCVSNLNAQSIATGYAFLVDPAAGPGPGWTTMDVAEYGQDCIPDSLKRF